MCQRGEFDSPQGKHWLFTTRHGREWGWGGTWDPHNCTGGNLEQRYRCHGSRSLWFCPALCCHWKTPPNYTLGRCTHPSSSQVYTPTQTEAVIIHPASVVGRNLEKFRQGGTALEMVLFLRTLISNISANNRIFLEFEIRDRLPWWPFNPN